MLDDLRVQVDAPGSLLSLADVEEFGKFIDLHIRREEEVYFPALEPIALEMGLGSTSDMYGEHDAIRIRIEEIQEALSGAGDTRSALAALRRSLLVHVLRRLDMPAPRNRLPSFRSGELEIDFASQEVRLRGERVAMTPIEYKLLYHLVRNAGRILPHETLLSRVWGKEYEDELDYLRVYIRRLRDKLEDNPTNPSYIRTERGIGYRFLDPAAS